MKKRLDRYTSGDGHNNHYLHYIAGNCEWRVVKLSGLENSQFAVSAGSGFGGWNRAVGVDWVSGVACVWLNPVFHWVDDSDFGGKLGCFAGKNSFGEVPPGIVRGTSWQIGFGLLHRLGGFAGVVVQRRGDVLSGWFAYGPSQQFW